MYPELFRIGNFPINTYGVLLALGILLALMVSSKLASRDGLPKEKVYDLGLWTIIGGLIGSKILLLIADESYRGNLWNIFSLDFLRSGGVYYGGFIGGVLTLLLLVRFYELPLWKVMDAFAPGVAFGQAIGRLGCFSAGCCWGKPTSLPWGVHFSEKGHEYTGVPIYDAYGEKLYLHPTQLYEAISMLIAFLVLLWLHKKKRFDGQIFILYALVYATLRFIIEFFRDDPRGDLFGLTTITQLSTSQILSLLVIISALVVIAFRLKSQNETRS